MKNILIVNAYLRTPSFEYIQESLKKAFLNRGEELQVIANDCALEQLKQVTEKQPVLFFDKDILLGSILQKRGYRLINCINTIDVCDDKAKTFLALYNKVLMPETIIAPFSYDNIGYTNFDFLNDAEKKLGYPMVIKQSKGSFGKQVFLAENRTQCEHILNGLKQGIILQKYIQSSCGKDLRVYVIANKVVAYAMRENKNDFRSNVENGGVMKLCDVPKIYLQTAIKAAKAVGADFVGVDLLFTDNGPLVCEINSNAHFKALTQVTGVNVAQHIADYYLQIKNQK